MDQKRNNKCNQCDVCKNLFYGTSACECNENIFRCGKCYDEHLFAGHNAKKCSGDGCDRPFLGDGDLCFGCEAPLRHAKYWNV